MSFDKRKWNIEHIVYNMIDYSLYINNIENDIFGCVDDIIDIINKTDVDNIKTIDDIVIDNYIKDYYSKEKLELSKELCFDFFKLT